MEDVKITLDGGNALRVMFYITHSHNCKICKDHAKEYLPKELL